MLQGVFARIEQELDGFTATPSNFIDGGETVVVEGRYRGAVKATGQKFDAQFAHLFELRDGKIVHLQQYTDTGQFQKAAGA